MFSGYLFLSALRFLSFAYQPPPLQVAAQEAARNETKNANKIILETDFKRAMLKKLFWVYNGGRRSFGIWADEIGKANRKCSFLV